MLQLLIECFRKIPARNLDGASLHAESIHFFAVDRRLDRNSGIITACQILAILYRDEFGMALSDLFENLFDLLVGNLCRGTLHDQAFDVHLAQLRTDLDRCRETQRLPLDRWFEIQFGFGHDFQLGVFHRERKTLLNQALSHLAKNIFSIMAFKDGPGHLPLAKPLDRGIFGNLIIGARELTGDTLRWDFHHELSLHRTDFFNFELHDLHYSS